MLIELVCTNLQKTKSDKQPYSHTNHLQTRDEKIRTNLQPWIACMWLNFSLVTFCGVFSIRNRSILDQFGRFAYKCFDSSYWYGLKTIVYTKNDGLLGFFSSFTQEMSLVFQADIHICTHIHWQLIYNRISSVSARFSTISGFVCFLSHFSSMHTVKWLSVCLFAGWFCACVWFWFVNFVLFEC